MAKGLYDQNNICLVSAFRFGTLVDLAQRSEAVHTVVALDKFFEPYTAMSDGTGCSVSMSRAPINKSPT